MIRNYSTKVPQLGSEKDKYQKINLNDINLIDLKGIKKVVLGGYMSYKNISSLGSLEELISDRDLLIEKLKEYLSNLDDNKVYTLLSVIRWIDDETGNSKGITTGLSLKITKNTDIKLLEKKFMLEIISNKMKYGISEYDCELLLLNRVWYSVDEFKVSKNTLNEVLDSIILDSLPNNKNTKDLSYPIVEAITTN